MVLVLLALSDAVDIECATWFLINFIGLDFLPLISNSIPKPNAQTQSKHKIMFVLLTKSIKKENKKKKKKRLPA